MDLDQTGIQSNEKKLENHQIQKDFFLIAFWHEKKLHDVQPDLVDLVFG